MKKSLTLLATLLAVSVANAELNVKVYQADSNSFNVTSTLVTGEKDAILIDTGFTRADALRISADILDSKKNLTTILVSQADPDYYFGVETIKEIFPNVQVVTTPAVLAKIEAKLPAKLATWSPKMGQNAPRKPILPTALNGTVLTLEGETIEIRGTNGLLAHRPYVWIPSIQTITGNIGVFGNMHVWTADTQTKQYRQAWIAQLDEMKALNPQKVIAGHMAQGTALNSTAIDFTKTYLQTFEQALKGKDSGAVIATMEKAYPNLPAKFNLELGAKVNKGEMKW
ncbi:MBL fold metallo-hydrolase [Ursidibacter sp. B-7004-1]